MMGKGLLLATVAALVSSASADCAAAKTCGACLGGANCGWCQPGPIIWKNGSVGSRCGDNADKTAWKCPGSYTTDTCTMGYNCNASLGYKCVAAGMGEGAFQTQAACTTGCKKPAKLYKCDPTTVTCKEVPPGTTGGSGQSACAQSCSKDSYTCKQNGTQGGTCIQAPPGSGSPKADCMAGCNVPPPPPPPTPPKPHPPPPPPTPPSPKPPPGPHPPPPPPSPPAIYKCGKSATGNFTCATTNTSIGGSLAQCQAACKEPTPQPNTPPQMVGYWRGFQVQKGYTKGEFDFDFEQLTCTYYGPDKKPLKSPVQSTVDPATQDMEVWLTLSGKTIKGLIQYQPNTPETMPAIFAFGAPGADAPATIKDAVSAAGSTVYFMSKCINGVDGCAFKAPSAAQTEAARRSLAEEEAPSATTTVAQAGLGANASSGADTCNQYTTCGACIKQNSHCGWCSVPVKYHGGGGGGSAQCAGFDSTGKPDPPWTCPAMYKRTDCNDYLCIKETGKCREAQPGESGVQSKELCDTICKAPPPPTPPGPKPPPTPPSPPKPTPPPTPPTPPTPPKPTPPPKPVPPPPPLAPGWGCSAGNYTCVFGGDGGAKTKALCQASCKKPPHKPGTPAGLIGKWRGIGIQHTYKYGEWDGEFNATDFNFHAPDGSFWSAQVFTGGPQGAQLSFGWTVGPMAGKTTLAIYELSDGPVASHAVVGVDPVGKTKADWVSAEGYGTIWQLLKCGAPSAGGAGVGMMCSTGQ